MIDVDDNDTVSRAREILIQTKESIIKLNDAKRMHGLHTDFEEDREYIHERLTLVDNILEELDLHFEYELSVARRRQADEHKIDAAKKLREYKINHGMLDE